MLALAGLSGCGPVSSGTPATEPNSSVDLDLGTAASALAIGGRCTAPSLATGDNFACMVRPTGAVACWGSNTSRQLGVATPTTISTPTDVPGVSSAVAVAGGSAHACALRSDGTIVCWGSNGSGQLGIGSTGRHGTPGAVTGLAGVTAIAAGSQHTCALRNDGTVWCWGSNGSGRLGDGTTTRRTLPVQVQNLTQVTAISAGAQHTCALTIGGLAYCWGANSWGQLGDGSKVSRARPVPVSGGRAWRSLAAGLAHTCGVVQADGNAVECWGKNTLGQLGDGTIVSYRMGPTPVTQADGSPLVDGVMVAAGGSTSCVIRGSGGAACWGANNQGQIGDNTVISPRHAAADVIAPAPLAGAFLLIARGANHTCALSLGGEPYCWGYNSSGQLGDTTHTRRPSPTRAGSATGLTFASFASEDEVTATNGAEATSALAFGDTLLVAGRERAASIDAWVLRRSRDRGANWTTASRYSFDGAMQAPLIARASSGTLFLGGAADQEGSTAWVLRRSFDGGDTWTDLEPFVFERGQQGSLRALAVDSAEHLVAAGSAGDGTTAHWLVRASSDHGDSWFVSDDYAPAGGGAAHAIADAGVLGIFVAGHAGSSGSAHLVVRSTSGLAPGASWRSADDFQSEAGFDTIGESIAADLGGRVYVLARANGADGWRFVLRTSTNGTTWQTTSTFQVAAGSDTQGYKLLVDRAGTLHVVGVATRSGSTHGVVASSYDHGATWVVSDELGGTSALTDVVQDGIGALHAVGSVGAAWSVRSRACLGLAPSCGNWVIDPGELCDGTCSDCNDHDACTTDAMHGSPTTCDVTCTNTPITQCISGDGCCAPGCTSAQDLDCCTGPIENGACVDVSFKLEELALTSCQAAEHSQVTGASRGGFAVSSSSVFYTGAGPTNRGVMGRFDASSLGSGRATSYAFENIFSDLRNGSVYVLGTGSTPLSRTAGTATTLIPLDLATGRPTLPRITLSRSIVIASSRMFFAGYGRLVLYSGARVYDVQLPSGQVTDLGSMTMPSHNTCADLGAWGIAESFGGALYVTYASGAAIMRTRVPSGTTETLRGFTNLGATCAVGYSTATRRWYFEHAGTSEVASGSQMLVSCEARIRRPQAESVCGDGVLEASETCEGDCPTSCDDGDACTTDVTTGSVAACNIACSHAPITTCASGDGCCVAGCNAVEDDDCSPTCGNGVVEVGETCDGNCPASCSDGDACTTDVPTGSASTCSAGCVHNPVTACANGDGCCPSGCNASNDDDCPPFPVLSTLTPSQVTEGAGATTVTLSGSGLIVGAEASFDGTPLATTRISDTELRVTLAAPSLATAGLHTLAVATRGGTTSGLTFTVNHATPTASTLTPSSVTAGAATFTLTVDGTGFVSGAVVALDGAPLSTTCVSSARLTATVPAVSVATAGTFSVTATNPAPTVGPSAALTLTVDNPVPSLVTATPSSVTAGAATFTLTLDGTSFRNGIVASFGGSPLATTYVSGTRLTASVAAASVAVGGTYAITAVNPAPNAGTSAALSYTVNNPTPTLSTLTPASVTAGAATFTLTVDGASFLSGATVTFNGAGLATSFLSATRLTASVPASSAASGGTFDVAVTNPTPTAGASSALTLTVNNAVPTVSTLTPSSVTAGASTFTLTIDGSGFVSGAGVAFDGTSLTTSYVSSTRLTASVPASSVTTAGTNDVTVTNAAPTTGASSALTFTVNNPTPSLTTTTPSSVVAGAATFTLTVDGTSFVSGAVVTFNGAELATTYVSPTRVTASVPATAVATGGLFNVTVANPAPSSGSSAALTFAVDNPAPTLTSISPTTTTAGAGLTVTLNGSNFLSSSYATFGGTSLTTTFVSSTQLTASVPSGLVAAAGTYGVAAVTPTPGGGTSGTQSFSVTTTGTRSVFSYTGANQSFIVPAGVSAVTVKLWGAGGGGAYNSAYTTYYAPGGGGGYTSAVLAVTGGETLTIIVGGGGAFGSLGSQAGGGGGRSAIRRGSTELVTAGGGGGAAAWSVANSAGGPGGGSSGVAGGGFTVDCGGTPGTQSAGGVGGTCVSSAPGENGSAFRGGGGGGGNWNCTGGTGLGQAGGFGGGGNAGLCGNWSGGGGGGGYYGGGGGNGYNQGGGGGGSGYIGGAGVSMGQTVAGSGATPGNTSDSEYVAGVGAGGNATGTSATAGGNGYVVISTANAPTLTSINPASTTAGTGVTITLNGSNFISSSYATLGGTSLTTTYGSATQLTAVVPAGLVGTPGSYAVAVLTPAGGTSASSTFTVNATAGMLTVTPPSGSAYAYSLATAGDLVLTTPGLYTLSFGAAVTANLYVWGAGGGAAWRAETGDQYAYARGGGGGFSTAAVAFSAATYVVRVGEAGKYKAAGQTSGGGGGYGHYYQMSNGAYIGGGGGGYSGLFQSSETFANAMLLAGGGGGAGIDPSDGGAGGGTTGSPSGGTGGTQTSGGTGAYSGGPLTGADGHAGGGGGYYGGGANNVDKGGGGGSGMARSQDVGNATLTSGGLGGASAGTASSKYPTSTNPGRGGGSQSTDQVAATNGAVVISVH